ncbi:MAG: hypothetical protein Q8O28_06315 [Smithellaceae bacterium]|nr:hypothetical protein [Smithellaceae bacterium]
MFIESENKTVEVSCGTKQTEETRAMDWVERSVWTDRMLEALDKGVKGEVWFSLIDKLYRSKTLYAAWQTVKRNGGSAPGGHPKSPTCGHLKIPHPTAAFKT